MDPNVLIALWNGKLPEGLVPPPTVPDSELATCSQRRCRNKVAIKRDGTPARSCQSCLTRRAASCRRRRLALVADGSCRRCAYRKRLEGDFLCERCREERDVERDRKRRDATDADAIDEFAAQPEGVHKASSLDCGVSPWNARRPREANASYWSPNPDPQRVLDPDAGTYRRFRRC